MNMNEIAKKARVSQTTVSRVVNNTPGVADDTVRRVRETIRKLGYKPATRRPSVRSAYKGTPLVALLLFDRNYDREADSFTALLRGVGEALQAHDMGLLPLHAWDLDRLPAFLNAGCLKGVFLYGANPNPSLMEHIRNIPSVWLTSFHDTSGAHALVGNEAVGRLAAKYLLERGHRELAFVNAIDHHPALRVRGEAFQFEAFRQGVAVRLHTCAERGGGESTIALPLEEMERRLAPLWDGLLAASPRATGVFVPYDIMTALSYRQLHLRGVTPGKDLEFVSCNNQRSALAGLNPRPATIDIGSEAMGRYAVEQLLWRIRHPEENIRAQVVVEPMLVPGE
jgi:DNA-binding LacI/PurR family transcriptional regulator